MLVVLRDFVLLVIEMLENPGSADVLHKIESSTNLHGLIVYQGVYSDSCGFVVSSIRLSAKSCSEMFS